MTRRQSLQLAAIVAVFMLVGWGMGALVTSTLTSTDLHVSRDIASDRTAAATVIAHVFSWIGSGFVVFPVAFVCWLTFYRRGLRASALAVAISTVGAQVIIDLDKLLVGRHRPPLHRLDHVTGHSFPSGHTGQTAALCTILLLEGWSRLGSRRLRIAAVAAGVLLVVCVAFSRVYLGVHYLSDVLGGAILGVSWSVVASRLAHAWTPADKDSETASEARESVSAEPLSPAFRAAPRH
jgi:membrane-associated phospholipid phosphatase